MDRGGDVGACSGPIFFLLYRFNSRTFSISDMILRNQLPGLAFLSSFPKCSQAFRVGGGLVRGGAVEFQAWYHRLE